MFVVCGTLLNAEVPRWLKFTLAVSPCCWAGLGWAGWQATSKFRVTSRHDRERTFILRLANILRWKFTHGRLKSCEVICWLYRHKRSCLFRFQCFISQKIKEHLHYNTFSTSFKSSEHKQDVTTTPLLCYLCCMMLCCIQRNPISSLANSSTREPRTSPRSPAKVRR